jgi:cytochrome c553
MPRVPLQLVLLIAALGGSAGATFAADVPAATTAAADDLYAREVAPIFAKYCVDCHGDDEPEAALKLSSRDGLLYGSRSGHVVVPGKADQSMLLQLLAVGTKPHMPPEGQLADAEIAAIARWMDALPAGSLPKRQGPAAGDHWAYAPLTRPEPPAVRNEAWVRDPLDRFVLAKLEAAGIGPSPEADPAALCRRLYYDLIGLPPSPEQLDDFLRSYPPSPRPSVAPSRAQDGEPVRQSDGEKAYQALVEKLLASPQYGERWGRHWLDLARYADSAGYHEDVDRPYAWKYRDYVIQSFNADKPYARFVAEQLAGDELAPDDSAAWIATGFCRCGPSNDKNMGDGAAKEKYRLDLLDDVLSTSSAVFLGQTIGCARCHDHKLDPITQTEYYQFLALFDTSERVDVVLDDAGRPAAAHSMEEQSKLKKEKSPLKWSVMALTDAAAVPRKTHLLWRGDVTNRGPSVEPGVPAAFALEPLALASTSATAAGSAKTTGRRKALADWITSPKNPLTWRVVANRIWRHHIGEGIVATPSNFGRSGAAPTHPELLDYLAGEMIASGGSWKAMHRKIVMSATYRQAVATVEPVPPAARATRNPEPWTPNSPTSIDPENHLLWHAHSRRLEAEVLRDGILAVAGTLNTKSGGPGIKPRIRPELLEASKRNEWPQVKKEGPEHWRRSVYIYVKRQLPFPMLELFDQPNSSQTCERRDENVVPTQALLLMNDEFVIEQAEKFADRVIRAAGDDPARQTAAAVRMAFAREATPTEISETTKFLTGRARSFDGGKDGSAAARSALVDFCYVLFNSNEFSYLD